MPFTRVLFHGAVLAAGCIAAPAVAADPPAAATAEPAAANAAAPAAQPLPCTDPAYRAFDFWLGDWEVRRTDTGAVVGHNRIAAIEAGCGIEEQWTGASGVTGRSLNAYDATDGRWHQLWTSAAGYALRLSGGPVDGAMVMEGEMRNPQSGAVERQRIRWTPGADGSVRQQWEAQDAASGAWRTSFDGTYRRRAPG